MRRHATKLEPRLATAQRGRTSSDLLPAPTGFRGSSRHVGRTRPNTCHYSPTTDSLPIKEGPNTKKPRNLAADAGIRGSDVLWSLGDSNS